MPRLFLILLTLTLPLVGRAAGVDPSTAFSAANTAYETGKFDEARDTLSSIIDLGHFSPDVFYNLANTHYRLDQDGLASLNYRRALALAPLHQESAQNLRFLRRELGFLQPEPDATAQIANLVPSRFWLIALTAAAWVTVLAIAAVICLRRRSLPVLAAVAVAGIIVAAVATTALVSLDHAVSPEDVAVVITPGSRVLTAPVDGAGTVSELPPGSAVHILQRRGPWYYTAVDNDTRGWVHSSILQPLWPFDPALLP